MEKRYPIRLVVAGVLVLAASAAMVWSFFEYGGRAYLAYGVLLFATAVGIVLQQQWSKYIVYVYALTSAVSWCFDVGYVVWFRPSILASIVSLVPGLVWCAGMIAASWLVYREFNGESADTA